MDLKGYIEGLTERERIILSLLFVEELTYQEIGYVLGEKTQDIKREVERIIEGTLWQVK